MIIACAKDGCQNYISCAEASSDGTKPADEPHLLAATYEWGIHHNLKGEAVYLCKAHETERIETIWKGHRP